MEYIRTYLGDNVYASFKGDNLILALNTGFNDYNIIVLESDVFNALIKFREKVSILKGA